MVSPAVKQWWTVSAVLLNMCGVGMLLSFSSSLLPALADPRSDIQTDLSTASYASSIIGVAGIPGFFASSVLMSRLGRKVAHSLLIVPALVGWMMVYWANDVIMILVGRFLGGFTTGATVSLGAIAIGEYTSPKYRGMFLNLKTTAVCLGGMIVHILVPYCTWRTIALCSTVPHIAAIIIISTWKESPAWLAGRQEYQRCEESFYWLRGRNDKTYKELEQFLQAQMERQSKTKIPQTFLDSCREFLKKLTRKDFLKPCFVILWSTVLLETCGRHNFPAYAPQIIEEITGNKAQSFYFTLAIDAIIVSSSMFSSALIRMMKRRTLLFSTGFGAFAVLMTVCTYIFLGTKSIISNDTNVTISLFILYFILANLGCTPIPLALLGELYPLAHRGVGSATSGVFMSLFLMLALHITPHMLVSIKVYGTFAVFGLTTGVALIVLFFTLPETKDRTLQEIEDYFNNGSFKERVIDEEVTEKVAT